MLSAFKQAVASEGLLQQQLQHRRRSSESAASTIATSSTSSTSSHTIENEPKYLTLVGEHPVSARACIAEPPPAADAAMLEALLAVDVAMTSRAALDSDTDVASRCGRQVPAACSFNASSPSNLQKSTPGTTAGNCQALAAADAPTFRRRSHTTDNITTLAALDRSLDAATSPQFQRARLRAAQINRRGGRHKNEGNMNEMPIPPPRNLNAASKSLEESGTSDASISPTTTPTVLRADAPYFHGDISRQEAEQRLLAAGGTDGLYLIREKVPERTYALSVMIMGAVKHHLMESAENNTFVFNGKSLPQCHCVQDIIDMLLNLKKADGQFVLTQACHCVKK